MIDGMRGWWQVQTGEEETPFDGDAPAWMISMIVHMVGLLLIAFVSIIPPEPELVLTIETPEEEEVEELELPEKFMYEEQPTDLIGAGSMGGVEMALAQAPELSDISEVVPMETDIDGVEEIEIDDLIKVSTGPNLNANFAIKGAAGVGVSGAMGAVDRLTYEILLSLEERKTLVVWMFDQSGSLLPQRKEIHDRFDRIYEELGVIESSGHKNFAQHGSQPLLSSVIAFGKTVTLRTKTPTDDLAEIKAAVAGIEQDDSGIEQVFSAIYMAADKYKGFRIPAEAGGQPERNVMLIVFTDEVGDDKNDGLDQTIKICQRYAMPTYVVGVPAVFGRRESLVKWVDPDPQYDQTPQWGRVNQGPESFLAERLCLAFSGYNEDEEPLDSGFGPFHLTRLCYETGGIYFAVHPNRSLHGPVSKQETAAFSSHIRQFFDPKVMRKYKPDYVTREEYGRRLQAFPSRYALVKAAEMSWQAPMVEPRKKFVRKNDKAIQKELTEAVDAMNKVLPRIDKVYQTLAEAEPAREKEEVRRWQAGYDLGMGRALAAKVRGDGYRLLLTKAASGAAIKDPKNNHFEIVPAPEIADDPQLVEMAEKSKFYLNRVIEEHPDTPWAFLARKELDEWLGWELNEWYVDMTPRPRVDRGIGDGRGGGNGGGGGRGVGVVRRDNRPAGPPPPPPKKKRPPPRL
jgi:hypothetical protein